MIPEHIIESVTAATDLASLVKRYGVHLERAADGLVGLCPFHDEKTPSFRVHTKGARAGHYHCFGCSASGNAISFLIAIERWSFPRAVEFLASEAGIALRNEPAKPSLRAALNEDMDVARWWWKRRVKAIRAAFDLAFVQHTDPYDSDCEMYGRLLMRIEDMKPDERFRIFKSQVTWGERQEWAADAEWDKRFAEAWMSLAKEDL